MPRQRSRDLRSERTREEIAQDNETFDGIMYSFTLAMEKPRAAMSAMIDEIKHLRGALVVERRANHFDRAEALDAMNARLLVALRDAVSRPMGVVPDSAAEFWQDACEAA